METVPQPDNAPRPDRSNQLLVNLACLIQRPTGITTYALNILPALRELDPTLLTAQEFPGYRCYLIAARQTNEVGTQGRLHRLVWTQFQLPRLYRKLAARLIFSPLPEAPIYTACRSVVMAHDLMPLRFPRWGPRTAYFKTLVPQVLHQAVHVVCNSQTTADELIQKFHLPARQISVIPLAHDRQHFQPTDRSGSLHPLNPALPYFLHVGQPEAYKNLPRLLTAFASLPKEPRCELWLVGAYDRRATPKLQAQAQELGIADRVKFPGYVPYAALPGLMSSAIALVFPSLWEGFGIPVLEAMACGTPVITSNLAALPEVAGDAALLIDPYQPQEIAAAMLKVLKDDSLRQQLRQAGLQRAAQFSWEKTGSQTVEVLKQFIQ